MSDSRHAPSALTASRPLAGGERVDAHHHDEHQLVHAGRGVLSVTTEAGVWITPATRAIWIPAGTVHEHRAYGPAVLTTVGLPAGTNPLRLHIPTVLAVSPLLRELLTIYATTPDRSTPQGRRLRAVLLDQLCTADDHPLHLPAPQDPRLAALAGLLHHDPADQRSLPQLATAIGSSPRTVARLCRDQLGTTFPQWRTQIRVHHALQLLAQDVPVTSVAQRCGWATPSAFIDVFRRTTGHTPGRLPASTR